MPDFSLCTTEQCNMRKVCLRATSRPDPDYQSFSAFTPWNDECEFIKKPLTKQELRDQQADIRREIEQDNKL